MTRRAMTAKSDENGARNYGAEGFGLLQSLTHRKTPSAGCKRLETLDCASQPESKSKKLGATALMPPMVVKRLYQAVASPNRVKPPHKPPSGSADDGPPPALRPPRPVDDLVLFAKNFDERSFGTVKNCGTSCPKTHV